MRWITLSLVALGLVILLVVIPGSAEIAVSEESATEAETASSEEAGPVLEENTPRQPGTPALGVPRPLELACTASVSCVGGGSVSCSLGGTSTNCSSGTESCTTSDGCAGTRNFVQCGSTTKECTCVKNDPDCPSSPTCPDPNCPLGQPCTSQSQCGPCGACGPFQDSEGNLVCDCLR